jgi:hypothetical protein
MKKLFFILILNVSLLFSPAPKNGTTDPNGRWVSLSHSAGFFLNPDTYGYIFPSIKPKELLVFHAQRQNRPLFILAGSAIGYSITFITWPFHKQLLRFYGKFWRGVYTEDKILLIGNFYAGYILINILVLWMSLYMFERIFYLMIPEKGYSVISVYLLMVFIVSNPVTKAFFWTPHQQMFAFFTPLLSIYTLYRFRALQGGASKLKMTAIFLSGGILLLVYGNFIVLLPVWMYGLLQQEKQRSRSKEKLIVLLKSVGLIFIFFLPTFCWVGILKWRGLDYYNFEIEQYHQLVWIPETLHQSVRLFFERVLSNGMAYIRTMGHVVILLFFSLILFLFGKTKTIEKGGYIRSILFVFLCFFLFYGVLGSYFDRLTDTLIPIIVCLWVAGLRQKLATRRFIYILSSLALTWHFYILTSYGPFY